MKAVVNPLKCDTSGICVMQCPEIFRFQEGSKKATVLVDQIPPALEETCIRIALHCPTGAIKLKKSKYDPEHKNDER